MSTDLKPELRTLEKEPIWKEANALAEYMYSKLGDFPTEEKWTTGAKVRSTANDLMYYAALALGNASYGSSEYEWASLRKHALALKTLYRFASRQDFIELDPEIMVRFDSFVRQVDRELVKAYKKTALAGDKEMEPWLKKYALWKEMQNEN